MIVYKMEHPDYGFIMYKTVEDALEHIKEDIEANNIIPGITLSWDVEFVEMTEAEYAALPMYED